MIKRIFFISVVLFLSTGCVKQQTEIQDSNEKKLDINDNIVDNTKDDNIIDNTEDIVEIAKNISSLDNLKIQKIKVRNEKMIFINTSHYINFDTNKYKIRNEVKLNKLLKAFNTNSNVRFYLIGHTDSAGDDRYNQFLSELRAKEVYKYFLAKGFDKNKIDYIGYGEEQPISTNENSLGRKMNRRVEIIVSSTEKNAKYFIEQRKINTKFLNNHNKINSGNVIKTIKGQTKNKTEKEIQEMQTKISLPSRSSFDINIQKREHIIHDKK